MTICIAFLCIIPNRDMIIFAEKLSLYYNVFIFIDDNNYRINNTNSKVNYIKINNNECISKGYKFTQEPFLINVINNAGKLLTSWDKVIYYFCELFKEYDHLWIIEDDVFIPSINTIINIDNIYKNYDLLTQRHELGTLEQAKNNDWFWYYCSLYFKEPYYKSMSCCIRLSKKLMMLIRDNVKNHKIIPYHEFSFNTIAHQNGLQIGIPDELKDTIVYRREWKLQEFKIDKIYHPVKDFDNHEYYRKNIIS